MKKFDLEAFREHKEDNNTYCKYISINPDGNTVETYIKENKDSYQETVTYLNSPIKKRYMYDKKTLKITKEIKSFYDCIIGFRKEYNENGELVKVIDNDKPFSFSWQDLVEKMKKEFDIDLMDLKNQMHKNNNISSVSRNSQEMKYFVVIPNNFIPHTCPEEKFEIDATTGKLLHHIGNKKRIEQKNIF
ncbi:hypothetical protein [Flavobacterium sp. N1736]|uniref:hypothetical protein n=1 Tax=Flavobacterium sp. N1736 TaxID=2986823 RepID=UPI00222491F3|nr:hypothetical protein [Flavobacterium sp. N1736]